MCLVKKAGNSFETLLSAFCRQMPLTVFEIQRKSLIQHCERSELCLHFEWTKVNQKCQKLSILKSFWKSAACSQTALPDKSLLIRQKLVEKAKIQKFKCDILVNFQTMCLCLCRRFQSCLLSQMTWLKGDKSTLEPRVAERLMIVILTWAVSGGSPLKMNMEDSSSSSSS